MCAGDTRSFFRKSHSASSDVGEASRVYGTKGFKRYLYTGISRLSNINSRWWCHVNWKYLVKLLFISNQQRMNKHETDRLLYQDIQHREETEKTTRVAEFFGRNWIEYIRYQTRHQIKELIWKSNISQAYANQDWFSKHPSRLSLPLKSSHFMNY